MFELAFQFLRFGASQESYDHLSEWSVSPYLASASSRAAAPVMLRLQGYLGVVAWECARQAREEGARWAEMLQRREDGDDDGMLMGGDTRGASAAAMSSSRSSLSDLRLEVRTCHAKQLSFEKLARSKLRAAVNADRQNGLWLFVYLQCMQQFYSETMQQHHAGQPHAAPSSSAAAASASASSSSAAKSRVHLDHAKLIHLQQRLIRKIDDFIVADAASATGGQSAASGFHMRLHYLHLFTPHARSTQDRQAAWLTVAHLLRADPLSNFGIAHAWRLWEEQGQRDASTALDAESFASESASRRWRIRSADLIDLFAARLDAYPTEEWSWHALLRLMATHLRIDTEESALWRWKFKGVLEPATAEASHPHSEPESPLVAPASPASSSASASPLHRAVSRDLDSSSERGSRRADVGGGVSDSDSAASPSPVKKPRTAGVRDEKRTAAAAADASEASSAASSPLLRPAHSAPASPACQGSGSSGRSGNPSRSFPHLHLSSVSCLSDADRKSCVWMGRIEWWVQATGYWRDVPHTHPADAPPTLPAAGEERLLLLRGLCYWMTLRWMGWVEE